MSLLSLFMSPQKILSMEGFITASHCAAQFSRLVTELVSPTRVLVHVHTKLDSVYTNLRCSALVKFCESSAHQSDTYAMTAKHIPLAAGKYRTREQESPSSPC